MRRTKLTAGTTAVTLALTAFFTPAATADPQPVGEDGAFFPYEDNDSTDPGDVSNTDTPDTPSDKETAGSDTEDETDTGTAEDPVSDRTPDEDIATSGKDTVVDAAALPEATTLKDDANGGFYAQVYVYGTNGIESRVVRDSDNTLGQELEKMGTDTSTVRLASGKAPKADTVLKDGDSVVLYSDYMETTTQEVALEPVTVYVDDDTLEEGKEKVVSEGRAGKALETLATRKNTATDKDKNKLADDAVTNGADGRTEKVITVVEAPEKRVIHRGTYTPPPVQESYNYYNNAGQSADTSSWDSEGAKATYAGKISELQAATQNEAVALALSKVGHAYVWGAVGPGAFDCSGLIYWVYRTNLGKPIPRVAGAQGAYATPVQWSDIQPGDIIWRNNEHIGMYVGNGQMVHASTPTRGVVIDGIGWAQNQGYKVGRFE